MNSKLLVCISFAALGLTSCAQTGSQTDMQVKPSRIAVGSKMPVPEQALEKVDLADDSRQAFTALSAYHPIKRDAATTPQFFQRLSRTKQVRLAAEDIPLKELLQALLQEALGVNYVVSSAISALDDKVSLNLSQGVSEQRAFELLQDLLQSKGVYFTEQDGVIYLYPSASSTQSTALGYGRTANSVPQSAGNIMQIIPLRYGANVNLERTLRDFLSVAVSSDLQSGVLFITANRQQILRALDLIHMLDVPMHRGKNIGLIRLTYLTPEDFARQVTALLTGEGIPNVAVGSAAGTNVALVPVLHIGAVVVFSHEGSLIERVKFWAEQLDIPSQGPERRYFIYNPTYARASDLGESIANLIQSGRNQTGNMQRDTASALAGDNTNTNASASRRSASAASASVQNEKISMTVDERSNALIFHTAGAEYQALLPMIRRLDIMPKQVLLEAMIAEVTLTDQFAMGVEFAIRNGSLGYGTAGAFGVGNMGGFSLSYLSGGDQISAKLSASDGLVNVLSNPSIVVRDGVSATISVGDDIPTISATTSDPLLGDRQTTTITYRKTGLEFTVVPTINAQGLVVMEINQSISSTVDGSSIEGSPAIFQRSIKTEVIAESGQTIMLGGLISEDSSRNQSQVPGFGRLPLIGGLFRSETRNAKKTELILLITPRVIDSSDQWFYINDQIQQGFNQLRLDYSKGNRLQRNSEAESF